MSQRGEPRTLPGAHTENKLYKLISLDRKLGQFCGKFRPNFCHQIPKSMSATNESHNQSEEDKASADSAADLKVVAIVFFTLVVFAMHFVSGWTFDI